MLQCHMLYANYCMIPCAACATLLSNLHALVRGVRQLDAEHSSIRPTPAQASVLLHMWVQGMSEHRPAAALGRVVAERPNEEATVCGSHGSGSKVAVEWQWTVLNACLSRLHGCSTGCKLQQGHTGMGHAK